jgi:hypothetical protein
MANCKGMVFVIIKTGIDIMVIGSKENDTALFHITVPTGEKLREIRFTTSIHKWTKTC